jgi:hypothetical protein
MLDDLDHDEGPKCAENPAGAVPRWQPHALAREAVRVVHEGRRHYHLDGECQPSVTSVVDMLPRGGDSSDG